MLAVIVAAVKGLLVRYTSEAEITVGVPCDGGFTLWRTDASGDPSLGELLVRVASSEREMELALSIPQVIIAWNCPLDLAMGSLEWGLVFRGRGELLEVGWHYDANRFDSNDITRGFGHLTRLLESFAADERTKLGDVPLLSESERCQLLVDWNSTDRPFDREMLIHEPFEMQAALDPEMVALVCGEQEISYGALHTKVVKLARHLRSLGVDRGKLVGVCLERSIDLVVAVLAITKAGGAYVPVDPAWPIDRMRRVLASREFETVALVTDASMLRIAHDLQCSLSALRDIVLLNVATPKPPEETLDVSAVRALWDHVAEAATDRVSAAGFLRSASGVPFSEAEVDEYRDCVLSRVEPWLRSDKHVIEIGCGSGLMTFAIAPRVATYTGIDPSEATQRKNRQACIDLGLTNVEFPTGFATDIAVFNAGSFDLVVLASVIQFFPGPMYLESVLASALRLLAPGGALLIADVINPHLQEQSLQEAADRQAWARQWLRLDEDWFYAFAAEHAEVSEARVHHRDTGFDNELRHRYDVVLRRAALDEHREPSVVHAARRRISTGFHVELCASDPLPRVGNADDPAYVIYTSGSTGQPKGVIVQHRSAINLIDWVNRTFEVNRRDRLLFVASICFDLSVYDIFGVLAAGGSLHIAEHADLKDPSRLAGILADGTITFWDSAPAGLQQLVPFFPKPEPGKPASLRLVFLSGDWIPVKLPDAVRAAFSGAEVVSLGGATEATVWSNFFRFEAVDPAWVSIPYGKPIQNCRYHVLDSSMQLCPIGVRGDLYIGGECLARGYIDDATLTERKFVRDVFCRDARLYRTGDLARRWADGNLEFLGRADSQVKIRGFRIELGEIESLLVRHPGVREAVACVREDTPDDRRIVVYYVARGENEAGERELEATLREQLPSYMIPSAYVAMNAIPLTSNGKVARDRLPAPTRKGSGSKAMPVTEMEQWLARTWEEMLGVSSPGLTDDFFALGGHSMTLVDMLFRIETHYGVKLTFREVVISPTLAEVAALIERHASTQEEYCHTFDLQVGDEVATFRMSKEDFQREGLPEGAFNVRIVKGVA